MVYGTQDFKGKPIARILFLVIASETITATDHNDTESVTERTTATHTFDSGAPALVGPFMMMTCDDSLIGVTGSCCDVASAILVADDRCSTSCCCDGGVTVATDELDTGDGAIVPRTTGD